MARVLRSRLNHGIINQGDYFAASFSRFNDPTPPPAASAGESGPELLPPLDIQRQGTNGNDTLNGGAGIDVLLGHQGADTIHGAGGGDILFGLAGNDTLSGENDGDTLYGDSGNDSLYGGAGSDILYGDRNAAPALLSAAAQQVVDDVEARIGASDFAIIYQGSSYNQASLTAADHDMIFVNPARVINTNVANGETLWTPSEVNGIEGSGKALIGYLNLAKINDWVGYWSTSWTSNGRWNGNPVAGQAPAWLGGIDGDYTRNVKFWEDGWLDVLLARVDVIIAKGFSGIFLDDLLEYFDNSGISATEGASEMRALVVAVAEHAVEQVRLTQGQAAADAFVIVVNGAPFINGDANAFLPDLDMQARFFAAIDGLLVENYFSQGLGYAVAQAVNEYGARGIALLSADTGITTAPQQFDIEEAAVTAGFLPETTPGTLYADNTTRFAPGALAPPPGQDVLDGGTGADQMYGGTGNDVYIVDDAGDAVFENAGAGSDGVYSAVSYTLAAGTDVETLSTLDWNSTAALDLTGNGIANWLIGNAGVNQLRGLGGNDIIEGKGGDDFIDGGSGVDAMFGGTGNDVYLVDNVNDAAVETTGQGSDGIYTTVSYALAAGADIETLSTLDWNGTAAINLTGNAIANYLIGNAGANQLNGGGGNDLLVGKAGNDVYIVDSALDGVFENAGEGSDAAYSSASYTLTAGSEVETLSTLDWNGTAALNLTGNELANYLIGNAGANMLNGGGGNDALVGRGGADTFAFTTALGATNVDHIGDMASATDKIALDHNVFVGLGLGALNANAFRVGTSAQDADDRIVYNSATGELFFDADGNGAGAAVRFAIVDGAPALTVSDFTVI